MSINESTGDKQQTKVGDPKLYDSGWQRIFGKKKEPCSCEVWSAGCCTTELTTASKKEKHSGCCGECC